MVVGRAARLAANGLLVLMVLLTIGPLLWMVSVSLMAPGEASRSPPPFWPAHATLYNYRHLMFPERHGAAFTDYRVLPAIWNSLGIAALSTLFGLLLAVPAGYAFAKLRFRGRARLMQATLALMVIPAQVGMLPLFLMLRAVGLVNSWTGAMAPGLAGLYAVLFTRQAALAIPDEMLDAARLDGASEGRIFVGIVLPLLQPIVVTLALFAFVTSWSDFLWPLIVLSDQGSFTLPVALASIGREHGDEVELLMAGAVLTSAPVLLLFLALQRFYFDGILGGSVKG